MTFLPPPWVASYIGLPYLAYGRDRAGLDCWGLVRLVMAEQFGLDLPAYDDVTYWAEARGATADHVERTRIGWVEVAARPAEDGIVPLRDARPGDVAVMRFRGLPVHVGILVAPRTLLHTLQGQDSSWDRLDRPALRHAVDGIYRHPEMRSCRH